MKLVHQTQWICQAGGVGSRVSPVGDSAAAERWLLHGLGCVRITRTLDRLKMRLDGRLFEPVRCERLLEAIAPLSGQVAAYDFTIWSGTADGTYALSPAAETVGIEGAELASAVLLDATDASAGNTEAVVLARGPVVLADAALVIDASVDDATKRAAKLAELAAHGLVARIAV
ncbi:hypothetical protein BAL199_00385 [alpha proteobacterium BAL199]|nr:hypothetical protein BAL199_00385 [alpha proteobacterium BAL199]